MQPRRKHVYYDSPMLSNVEAHWPEANGLLKRGVCDPDCGIPDYNTLVTIAKA